MKRWFATVLAILTLGPAAVRAQELFEVKLVAPGVYAAIAKPHRPENSNSAIFVLKGAVLVVDTASTPSSGRELVREIKKLTDKPVKYVVNTHFHWDHYWGNEAFVEAWPDVQIISSEATRLDMQRMGLGNPLLARWQVEVPESIEKWKTDFPKTTDETERRKLQDRITKWGAAVEEFKKMHPALPNLTFNRQLVLDDDSERVEVLWLGRAHTPGDVVVYLPERRVLASGDLLAGDTPYIGVVRPEEWVQTLDGVRKLDFDYVIPGHGDVMRGKDRLDLWKRYLTDVVAETTKAFEQGASLDEARGTIVPILKARYAAEFPPDFQFAVAGNVVTTYRMVSGRQN